jgi:DNA-binding transcriptional LysR family regulator
LRSNFRIVGFAGAQQVEKAIGSLERYLVATDETPTGSVRVTCSESIGSRLTQSSLLEIFHSRHPGLRVELIMSDHFLDIAKGEADVAIRAGVPNEETRMGRLIADVPWSALLQPRLPGAPRPGGTDGGYCRTIGDRIRRRHQGSPRRQMASVGRPHGEGGCPQCRDC